MFDSLRTQIADLIAPEAAERRKLFERQANTDPLTGLANRRAFDLARATAESDPDQCVILFDANHFGQVNKLAGHDQGDQVLIEIARALREVAKRARLGDRVFRLGGDEFAIISPCRIAEAVRDRCEYQFKPRTFSAGAVTVTISGTVGRTIAEADRALQARKAARKASNV